MRICQGSSAWESTRLKTELSRVQVPPLALFYSQIKHNILIEDIPRFSEFLLKSKKSKTAESKPKKIKKKSAKTRTKKSSNLDDVGIVVIDDDLRVDTEKELEERRAFLEEARSQDASD